MNDWPHQTFAVEEVLRLAQSGRRRLCVTSPTGGGKSRIMQRLIERHKRAVVYTNRIMLLEQLINVLDAAGLRPGVQASGYAPSFDAPHQVAMIQTVESRWAASDMHLHDADLVIVDERHNEKGERLQRVLEAHREAGALEVAFTATPIGLGGLYDELIQAGTTSELRRCGALVPANTFAPDEPDPRAYKSKTVKGILQFRDELREVMLKVIFGRVIEHYRRLNPERRPAILFAPGVEESRWFAEEFNRAGIPWSHIDGERISINGVEMNATRENRERLKEASISGETCGVSNRFVMREGIDWPHLWHGIFACTFGSISSYMQAGGRLLRNHPSLDGSVVIQDHGGNFWRHDSLNADRIWSLDDTEAKLRERHADVFRTKAKPEPIVCPKCQKVRASGPVCQSCQFSYKGHRRIVVQTDGTLREVRGDIYRPRPVSTDPEDWKAWKACVFRCRNSNRTFNQARALFQRENHGRVPGPDFPLMPNNQADWYSKVADVPFSRLGGGNG